MPRLLFVEDHLGLIDELARICKAERPSWKLEFTTDIASAWNKLCDRYYDLVVIDVMLPGWKDVLAQSEGIWLAAWVRGKDISSQVPPPEGTIKVSSQQKRPKVALLTSRSVVGVQDQAKTLINEQIPVIGRLRQDALDHYEQLRLIIENT